MKESIDAQLDSRMLNDLLVDKCTKSPFIVAHVNILSEMQPVDYIPCIK